VWGERDAAPDIRLERGVLVVFEGIDGAGKTTQARLLERKLRDIGVPVVSSKEPTNGPHGTMLRESASKGRLKPEEELEAFEADRREHVANLIAPSLAAGSVVIVDRYYFSTAAYQGAAGLDPEEILARSEAFAPQPDLLVILGLPVRVALDRIQLRGDGDGNLFERESVLVRCAAIFGRIQRPYLLSLDGMESAADIHAAIMENLLHGALFRAACRKAEMAACEPEYCTFRIAKTCGYPVMTARVSPKRRSDSIEQLNEIASDPTASPAELIGRARMLLRGGQD
jgi:dTMP kinase